MRQNACGSYVPPAGTPECSPGMQALFNLFKIGTGYKVEDRLGRDVTDQFSIKEFTDGHVELSFKNIDLPESCKTVDL